MTTRTDATAAVGHVWLTTAEAAAYTRMCKRSLLTYARSGQLQGEQVAGRNGSWRFHRDWLDTFLGGRGRLAS